MNKFTGKRLISALALCAVSVSTLMSTGCGKTDEKKKIAVITKQDISFWHDVEDGAKDAAEEMGAEILYNEGGSSEYPQSDNDFATQIEYINYAISEKVDAIVLAPNGTTELNEALAKAQNAGIKLININSRSQFDGILSCISSSDIDGGAVAARHAASSVLSSDKIRAVMASGKAGLDEVKDLGKGAVAIIGHTAATADNRINGFKKEAASQIQLQMARDGVDLEKLNLTEEQIAGMFLQFFIDGERCSTVDAAYDEAKKILSAKDCNVVCLFTTNTNTTLGACKAVDELDLGGQVSVIGFNADEEELNYLKRGILDGTVVQNPYNMGYVSVRYAIQAAKDSGVPGALDTGVTYVTADNLNDDYVQLLINPENY